MKYESEITVNMVCTVLARNATTAETPEGKLWLAVLINAVRDSSKQQHKQECLSFFSSGWFKTICGFCGLDPQYTREIIGRIGQEYSL